MVRRRLTPLGKLFAGLLFLFYVASVTSQSGLLLLFIGLIGGCYVVNWWFATRSVKFMRVTPPEEVYLEEGGTPAQPWRFENYATKHAEIVEVLHEKKILFRIPVVKTKESVSVVPGIVYKRRGVYPNARVTLTCAAPYGLLRATRTLQLPGEVVVFPRVYNLDSPASAGTEMISGGRFRGARRVSNGSHFAGVRAWQSGDSIKQVHWKSTARRGDLMVKTFEEELGGRVSLILDCSRANEETVDNAVRAAASLVSATLQDGHHLELIDLTEEPVLRLAPFSDESEVFERLARYEVPVKRASLNIQDLWRRSSVVLVSTQWNEQWEDLIAEARQQRRSVHVYLPPRAHVPLHLDAEIHYYLENSILEEPTQFAR